MCFFFLEAFETARPKRKFLKALYMGSILCSLKVGSAVAFRDFEHHNILWFRLGKNISEICNCQNFPWSIWRKLLQRILFDSTLRRVKRQTSSTRLHNFEGPCWKKQTSWGFVLWLAVSLFDAQFLEIELGSWVMSDLMAVLTTSWFEWFFLVGNIGAYKRSADQGASGLLFFHQFYMLRFKTKITPKNVMGLGWNFQAGVDYVCRACPEVFSLSLVRCSKSTHATLYQNSKPHWPIGTHFSVDWTIASPISAKCLCL